MSTERGSEQYQRRVDRLDLCGLEPAPHGAIDALKGDEGSAVENERHAGFRRRAFDRAGFVPPRITLAALRSARA